MPSHREQLQEQDIFTALTSFAKGFNLQERYQSEVLAGEVMMDSVH